MSSGFARLRFDRVGPKLDEFQSLIAIPVWMRPAVLVGVGGAVARESSLSSAFGPQKQCDALSHEE